MNFYIYALLATILGYLLFIILVKEWLGMQIKKSLLFSVLAAPLCPLVNLLIKKPIFGLAFSVFGLESSPEQWPLWFLAVSLFVAPFTEEGVKSFPAVISDIRKGLLPKLKAYGLGFSLGFGFGVGEIWYLAWALTRKMPKFATGPILELTGFFGERFLVFFVHGFLTAIVVTGIAEKKGWRAYMIAVAFHAFINLGAALYQAKMISVYFVSIPMMLSIFLLILYAFKVERKIRGEMVPERTGEILFKRGHSNER